jgi:hypothetical protein
MLFLYYVHFILVFCKLIHIPYIFSYFNFFLLYFSIYMLFVCTAKNVLMKILTCLILYILYYIIYTKIEFMLQV